jgi:hypothetical protein
VRNFKIITKKDVQKQYEDAFLVHLEKNKDEYTIKINKPQRFEVKDKQLGK